MSQLEIGRETRKRMDSAGNLSFAFAAELLTRATRWTNECHVGVSSEFLFADNQPALGVYILMYYVGE